MKGFKYYEADVREGLLETGIPNHMHEAVINYLVNHVQPGSFLTAVLSNEFVASVAHADDTNAANLRSWARWAYNCLPSRGINGSPWGSYAAVKAWCENE